MDLVKTNMVKIVTVLFSCLILFTEAFYVGNEKRIVTPILATVPPTVVNSSTPRQISTTPATTPSSTTVTTPETSTTEIPASEIEPRDQNPSNDTSTTTDSSLIEGQPMSEGDSTPESAPQPIPQEPPATPEAPQTSTLQESDNDVTLDEKSGGGVEEVAEIDGQRPSEREIEVSEADDGMAETNVTKIIQKTTTKRQENVVVEEQYEYYSPIIVNNP